MANSKPKTADDEKPKDGEAKPKKRGKRLHVRADLAEGGSLHIRHMMREVRLDGVAVALADDETQSVWIQLAKPGAFKGHPAGPFEMTGDTFREIVRNFTATQNKRIPIDFEHASEADPTEGAIPVLGAPAQGWIVDLKIDGGNLWGLVEWGPKAREYIKGGQYRYFSPAIRFGARDRVTGQAIGARMTSGALTNNPFLDGMAPLAAKDSGEADDALVDMVDELVEAALDRRLGNDDTSTATLEDDTNDDSGAAMGDRPAPQETLMDEAVKMKELETSNATLALQLKDATGKAEKLEGEIKTLRDDKAKRDEKDLSDRVEEAFATYKDAKKLTDADKVAMLIVLKAEVKTFDTLYPKVAPNEKHLMRDLTQARTPSDATTGAGTRETRSSLVRTLMKDRGLNYADAQAEADRLQRATA